MEKEILKPDEGSYFSSRQSCMDGLAEFRDISCCEYPWLNEEQEKKANEYHGVDYDKVLGKKLLSARTAVNILDTSDPQHGESQHYTAPTSATVLGETTDFLKPRCTNDDFFRVRLEMHHAKESRTSQEDLFKSEAKQEELDYICPNPTSSYFYHAISNGLSATSYAHFFHTPSYLPFNYVQPTTLEGDNQYIVFFKELVELARYRDTRDMVLAKAIALASSDFRKMRFFQLEIAVDDCLKLMDHGETRWQRQELYYYIVHEIVFKRGERDDVIKHIQEGQVQLFYDLTEFDCLYVEDAKDTVLETVYHLVNLTVEEFQVTMYYGEELLGKKYLKEELPSSSPEKKKKLPIIHLPWKAKESIKKGTYKKMIHEELDKLFPRKIELYMHFLKEKIKAAKKHNVIRTSEASSRKKELLKPLITPTFGRKNAS